MSALAFNAFRPQIQQVMAEDPTDLTRIFSDEVNLVSWQRNADNAIAEYCRTLALTMPIKRIVHVDSVQSDIGHALPDAQGKEAFLHDIALLCHMFSCLMDCQQLGLRLETLRQPMCPKFHTDHLVCRLVCTYLGPGTEWLDANANTLKAAPFAVTLLKGSGWEGNEQHAIVHRSPAGDAPRVLLTLDPM
ncbi:DUF1826 domain-containing protein [Alishewanella sp. HL-SH05]|uniref:DUF1826 domain-containing protein n=1 Tax=Alishewanella sp. HL-SH05 TaxID=3461145 RepID=UPI004042D77D